MTRTSSDHYLPHGAAPDYWWEKDCANPGFLRAVVPTSTWDERLLEHIDNHLDLEADASSAYESLAAAGDPQIRYLAGVIADDERRHHATLLALATSVRSTVCEEGEVLEWGQAVPLDTQQRDALLNQVRRLLAAEKADVDRLKELRRDVRLAPDGTLWPELIAIMSLDSGKHTQILKAIERRLKRR